MTDDSSSPLGKLIQGSFILFIGLVIQLGLGFLSRILIARTLGEYSYGSVALGQTLLMSLSTIILLGTKSGIARYLPRSDDIANRRGVIISAFQIVLPASVAAAICVVLFSDSIATVIFHDPGVGPSLRVFGAAVPLVVLLRLTIGISRGNQQSLPRVLIKNIILPISQFGLIALALYAGYQATGVSFAYFGAYALIGIPCVYYLVRYTPMFDSIDYNSRHRELFSFSLPLMTVGVMELVFEQLDTFIIGFYSTVGTVGVYNSVYPLAVFLTTILISFRFLAMPILSELHAEDNLVQMKRMFQVISKWIFIVTVPLLFMIGVFPRNTIRLTFGLDYVSGSTALSILAIGFFTHAATGLNGATLTSIGKTRVIMWGNILVAAINLILNFLLIPQSPLVGAAIATTVAYSTLNFIFAYVLFKFTGIHPFTSDFLEVAALSVIFIIGGFLLGRFVSPMSNLFFVLFVFAFSVLYLLSIVRFMSISEEEIRLVSELESKFDIDTTLGRRLVRVIRR
jgi:O-antigen/teichoic acid export membrane protein